MAKANHTLKPQSARHAHWRESLSDEEREALAEYKRQWYQANKARSLAEQKAKRDAEPDQAKVARREYHKQYYNANRESQRTKGKEWYLLHRTEISAANRKGPRPKVDPVLQRARKNAWEREFRKKHPERAKARSRRCYQKNKRKYSQQSRARYESQRERILVRGRRYRAEKPHKHAEIQRRRNAILSSLGNGDFTRAQWEILLATFNYHCAYCLCPGKLTRDHLAPLTRGGAHTMSNIVPACRSCNSRKHTKTLLEFCMAQ